MGSQVGLEALSCPSLGSFWQKGSSFEIPIEHLLPRESAGDGGDGSARSQPWGGGGQLHPGVLRPAQDVGFCIAESGRGSNQLLESGLAFYYC